MIDQENKNKLIEEISKFGNVYQACRSIGIGRATYYRWLKEDKKFSKMAQEATKLGRENICDMAEGALVSLMKDKDLGAIKYVLSNNSKIYKPKGAKVVIEHRRKLPEPLPPQLTLEDLLDEADARSEMEEEKTVSDSVPAANSPGTPILSFPPVQSMSLSDEKLNFQKDQDVEDNSKLNKRKPPKRRFPDDR